MVVYDTEVMRNVFLLCCGNPETRKSVTFEISERRDDRESMFEYLRGLYRDRTAMASFNGLAFDWPLLNYILNNKKVDNEQIHSFAQKLIKSDKMSFIKHTIPQIDLYKVHHFDNHARATSLKVLEFNMRMDNIEDLPFEPGSILSHAEIDVLRRYVKHDVRATADFLKASHDALRFRSELSKKYKKNFMNYNDVRIGKEIFIDALTKAGVRIKDERGNLRQTPREQIVVRDILLPVSFKHPELRRVHEEFKNLIITNTKGDFKLSADLDGFILDYGTGGLHGSKTDSLYVSNDTHVIENVDVSSYYPNLAIKNRFYPHHLTETFCDVYEWIYEERKKHKKGSAENAAYKLALNGTYGASNSEFSPFYDPSFTMQITINGQLQLSYLCDLLLEVDNLELLNVNTDGVCYYVPRNQLNEVDTVLKKWENETQLELEKEHYSRMYMRDVNSYILCYEEQQ
jgi:hypothetical protein